MTIKEYYNNLPEKVQKILKSVMISILGILATFLEEQIPGLDFGKYAVYAVGFNSVIVAAIRQYIAFCLTDKS
jgi:hypothetical protein